MSISKTFSCAVRSMLFITLSQKQEGCLKVDTIYTSLGVPRPFLSKLLQPLAKS